MFSDDLNAVVADAFGEPATIRRDGRPDAVVTGVYDSRHYRVGDGPGLSSLVSTLAVVDADVGDVPTGSLIEARGVWHRVTDRRPDGQGLTVLALEFTTP